VVAVALHANPAGLDRLHAVASTRLIIGDECFAADLSDRCSLISRRHRCHR